MDDHDADGADPTDTEDAGKEENPDQDDHWIEAHLDAFFFDGSSVGSSVPGLSSLHLNSGPERDRELLHVHETAHRMLYDDTAWGAALHVLHVSGAEHRGDYRAYLAATKLVHEAWATFASVIITARLHPDVVEALRRRRAYRSYLSLMEDLLVGLEGDSRRYFAASAVAHACSRTPVLSAMFRDSLVVPQLTRIPPLDQPDERFAALRHTLPEAAMEAAERADSAFADVEGRPPTRGLDVEADDAAWTAWAESFEESVCELLRSVGAHMPDSHAYLDDTTALQGRLPSGHPGRKLRVASSSDESSDEVWLHENLAATRWPLAPALRPARYGDIGGAIDADELVDLVTQTSTVSSVPELTLHLRPKRRLVVGWRWDPRSAERLNTSERELRLCVRVPLFDEDTGQHDVLHIGAQDLVALLGVWAHRGPLTAVVSTSCFLTAEAMPWLTALLQVACVVVLLDVSVRNLTSGPGAFLPAGSSVSVRRAGLPAQGFDTLQWLVPGQGFLGMAIADGTSIELIREHLRSMRSVDAGSASVWEDWDAPAERALRSLLTTESYFDLRGASDAISGS